MGENQCGGYESADLTKAVLEIETPVADGTALWSSGDDVGRIFMGATVSAGPMKSDMEKLILSGKCAKCFLVRKVIL